MSVQRLYRVKVTHWPTVDGKPWSRWYGDNGRSDANGIPEWLERIISDGELPERERRGYGDEVIGFVCPSPTRRHWISRTAAEAWATDARLLGAHVEVIASDPITWPERDDA